MTPCGFRPSCIRCLLSIYLRARGREHGDERHGPALKESAVWVRRRDK